MRGSIVSPYFLVYCVQIVSVVGTAALPTSMILFLTAICVQFQSALNKVTFSATTVITNRQITNTSIAITPMDSKAPSKVRSSRIQFQNRFIYFPFASSQHTCNHMYVVVSSEPRQFVLSCI